MQFLKQSTASQVVRIGPFVDDTDFKTAKTGLTIANTDIKLYKGDAATSETNKNSGGATHVAAGRYYLTLDATDTNTLGRLDLFVKMSGALEVVHEFMVVPAQVYDSLFGSDILQVDIAQFGNANGTFASGRPEVNTTHAAGTAWGSGAITAAAIASNAITSAKIAADAIGASQLADNAIDAASIASAALTAAKFGADCLANSNFADGVFGPEHFTSTMLARMGVVSSGTAQSASTTGCVLASGETFADDTLIGRTIMIFGSTQGYWQSAAIGGNVGSTDTVTFDQALAVAPSGTLTYIIFGTPAVSAGSGGLDAAGVRSAIGMSSANLDTQLAALQSDTDNIQTRLPAALVSGRMDASVGAMASGVLTATAIAADAITDAKVASDVTIASVTGAVGSVTGNVGGNVVGSVGSIATGGITAASFAADAITAAKIASDVGTEIAAAVLAAAASTPIQSDIRKVNNVTVNGNGAGTPWGP